MSTSSGPLDQPNNALRLRSPEQLEAELGYDLDGKPHVSQWTIRRAVREGKVPALRGSYNKVVFDDRAVEALLDYLRQPITEFGPAPEPDWEAMGNPFNFATKAGQGRGRRRGQSV